MAFDRALSAHAEVAMSFPNVPSLGATEASMKGVLVLAGMIRIPLLSTVLLVACAPTLSEDLSIESQKMFIVCMDNRSYQVKDVSINVRHDRSIRDSEASGSPSEGFD